MGNGSEKHIWGMMTINLPSTSLPSEPSSLDGRAVRQLHHKIAPNLNIRLADIPARIHHVVIEVEVPAGLPRRRAMVRHPGAPDRADPTDRFARRIRPAEGQHTCSASRWIGGLAMMFWAFSAGNSFCTQPVVDQAHQTTAPAERRSIPTARVYWYLVGTVKSDEYLTTALEELDCKRKRFHATMTEF